MKLQLQASSLGAITTCRRCALFLPPNQHSVSNLSSKSRFRPAPITTKPILPSLFPGPALVPDASRITPTPIEYA
jgi:hypothetical protein